jgi:hypothetical protein
MYIYKPSIGSTVVKRFKGGIHFTSPLQKAHISHLDMACMQQIINVMSNHLNIQICVYMNVWSHLQVFAEIL